MIIDPLMSTYLLLKWIHILSSVLLVGTGFGSAFYLFFILRSKNMATIAEVTRLVVKADWWFTTPTIVIQPLTGIAMIELAGYSYSQIWVSGTLFLYLIAGMCWLPVLWLQIQMQQLAAEVHRPGDNQPAIFWRYTRYWELLGYPAFFSMVIIFALMVFKP